MKKLIALAGLAALLSISAGTATADSIRGKLALTGKIGIINPGDSDVADFRVEPDIGLIGGGGLLYGIDDYWAAEFDITRATYGSETPSHRDTGDFGITNISFGGQYRFHLPQNPKLVPYAGAGLDILLNSYDHGDVDTVVGVHASGGVDYFFYKQLALTAEIKGVLAPDADIKNSGGKIGNFNPSSFSSTVGVRFFFF
ncbi:outer membrane beta-barrel protein [Geobacter sp. SVR]|uniref:outer membrane beta-barrel protein n=1 Tax=Geobacter sp. SVR TaxID=2495594 RepID=UPI00143EFBC8|nr:outer membrane beta-barrel protein [Geobacter sp. SVR]BCS54828.1 outer membrane protein [Geobacter sp. SVR]GCF86364.1 outer membrane protein [Geobacter sp. SVR]